ncbi:hypothetical protein BGW36DRAFT_383771 [Talaromyces proteolyticus]|uniref:NAD-dependent epimerase/dehydratase domain-containing protein n=1 Tax=Talaromyces proteolyticus TaxID=1131652 RepID=A0AAD4PXX5_9EURO|nr:uncharacterized protein BGW36DRAFT_383771 [Talaromyces proteolyticus]KAH8693804.1 hypothetical protein BGW36DRAFT_383771 [Talaromyces proteolyticus]
MARTNYIISQGSRILVTGANGYIASHVCDILLGLGYDVRGTVRSEKPWLDSYFEHKYGKGRFEAVVVPSLDSEDTWKAIVQGVSGIAHIASDLSMNPDAKAVIPWVVNATLNALQAASGQPSVKRVVLTSSSAAAFISQPNVKGITVDADTWNDAAVKAAWDDSLPDEERAYHIYSASKTLSEREAWGWVRKNHPSFGFNTIVPNTNYGRVLCPEISGSTMTWTGVLLEGDDTVIRKFPPQWFVDVEDTARLHVIALLDPTVESERIFAFAEKFNWNDIVRILKELRPDNRSIPDPPGNEGRDLSEIVLAPKAEKMIQTFFGRRGWVGLKESLAAGIEGRW